MRGWARDKKVYPVKWLVRNGKPINPEAQPESLVTGRAAPGREASRATPILRENKPVNDGERAEGRIPDA